MQSTATYPSSTPYSHNVHARSASSSYPYPQSRQYPTTVPSAQPYTNPSPESRRSQEEASTRAMLAEIAKEEQFLKAEELRLRDRPGDRLQKLRKAHEEWIVYRVRKELEKVHAWREAEKASGSATRDADLATAAKERERLAEEARKRAAESDRERREKQLKEERDRAAREKSERSKGGPFAWEKYTKPTPRSTSHGQPPTSRPAHTTSHSTSSVPREWEREARVAREAWESYTARWTSLGVSASSSSSSKLRFGDIPWPIFSAGPFSPQDITTTRVGSFLLSRFHSTDKTTKERLRAAMMQWHPDKFEARWLRRVDSAERKVVTEGVGAVARALNELMAIDSATRK